MADTPVAPIGRGRTRYVADWLAQEAGIPQGVRDHVAEILRRFTRSASAVRP